MNIDKEKVYNYFNDKFELKASVNGWYRFIFPFDKSHRDFSAGVNFVSLYVKDHRSGYRKSVIDFIKEYEGVDFKQAIEILNNKNGAGTNVKDREIIPPQPTKIKLPKGYKSLMEGKGNKGDVARQYLTNRGFDVELLDSMGFGYVDDYNSEYYGYIIIPLKKDGRLQYYIGRNFLGSKIRYKNPKHTDFGIGKGDVLYNADALSIEESIIIVEGWADAQTMGSKGVATLGWALSERQKTLIHRSQAEEVIIIPDCDKEGENFFYREAIQVGLIFIETKKVKVININKERESGKDVNEIGADKIEKLIQNTKIATFESLISKLMD